MRQVPVSDSTSALAATPAGVSGDSTHPHLRTVHDFARCKAEGRKISIVTAYDAWSARLVAQSSVDAILIGDSALMVMHGHPTTLSASVGVMAMHTRAVARGAEDRFLITDLPFLAHRSGIRDAVRAVRTLVKSGAHAVKLEGVTGHEDVVRHIVESGVPVMGHVGLQPQSVLGLGGYRVQGRTAEAADKVRRDAALLADLGCFAIVLECVPAPLAERITAEISVPTIGIGAGAATDGQVLVLHDMLGLSGGSSPRFVRRYVDAADILTQALNDFDADVKARRFPAPHEAYA